jgi:competence protein ComGC
MNDPVPSPSSPKPISTPESSTAPYWRWGGYGLLILAFLDLLESLIPPAFMNPAWELQLMGITIERSPVLLLAFLFIFHAEWLRRARWERLLLPILSWGSMVVGILFLLMIPLLMLNMSRVNVAGGAQITAQLEQQVAQARSVQENVSTAQGAALEELLRRLGRNVTAANVEEVRQEVLAEVRKAHDELQRRAEEMRTTQKRNLHKRTYKHASQAGVVGGVLILLWLNTGWARKGRRGL